MKKIASFFAFILAILSSLCISVSAEDVATEAPAADVPQETLLQNLFETNGLIIFLGVVGVAFILAIILLFVSNGKSRKKYYAKLEKAKLAAEAEAAAEAALAEAPEATEEAEASAEAPAQENPYAYFYPQNGYYGYYGYGCAPATTYKDLSYVPYMMPAPVQQTVKAKPVKPVKPVKPIVARPVTANVTPEEKKNFEAANNKRKAKLVAAVAIAAVGCHLLKKISK